MCTNGWHFSDEYLRSSIGRIFHKGEGGGGGIFMSVVKLDTLGGTSNTPHLLPLQDNFEL